MADTFKTTQPVFIEYPLFNSINLSIFDTDFSKLDKRYTLVEKDEFKNVDGPIKLTHYQLIRDNLSEKLLLRLNAKNNSEAGIKSIDLQIRLRDENDFALCLTNIITLENDCVEGFDFNVASNAIVIPNNAITGDLFITRIVFKDGLSYDNTIAYLLSGKNKMEKDIAKYISLHPVGGM